ncbi:phage tail family protein [Streptomyces virginiae]
MAKLLLENGRDTLNLNEVAEVGTGVQARTGASGLGLPPVAARWLEGAGDGAKYRGRRVLARDIDIPLDIVGRDRNHFKRLTSRLAQMLAGPCTLRMLEDDDTDWHTEVVRTGGGDYLYGVDTTGNKDLQTVITFRAGDPYWTSSRASQATVGAVIGGSSFVSSFLSMPVASSQAIGSMTLENTGDALAYPVWTIVGPGDHFLAVSPTGERLKWDGELLAGQQLTIDTRNGTVLDQSGANRYSELDTAPRFWSIEPGVSTAEASLLNVTAASKIVCTWRPRKWLVV